MEGWITLHRKIKKHWIWTSQNRFQWWIDILLTVNHCDNNVLIKGQLVECKRGQSVRSLETWAKDWNVTKKTVRDFFILLHNDSMISSENLQITTRITVCNYDSYQIEVNAKETQKKRTVNAEETLGKRTQHPNNNDNNKEELKNVKNEKNKYENFNFSFVEKEFEKPFFEWLEYKNQINEPLNMQVKIENCYRHLKTCSENKSENAIKIVQASIGGGYKSLFKVNGFEKKEESFSERQAKIKQMGQKLIDKYKKLEENGN
jgi:hypothetical protein